MAARALLFTWLLALVAPVAAEPARRMKPEARAHLERGLRLYEHQKFDEAVAELRAGLAIDPEPDLLYALGQAERRRGNCKRAVEYYESCLALVKDPAAQAALRVQIDRCRAGDEEAQRSSAAESATAPAPTAATPPAAAAATPPAAAAATPPGAAATPPAVASASPPSAPPPSRAPAGEAAPKESAALPESPALLTPSAAEPAEVATAAPARPWYRDGLGMTLTFVGVAGVAAGGALTGIALARLDAADGSYQQYADARSAPTLWTAGIVALAAGGALTVGGIVRLAVVAARRSHSGSAQ